MAQLTDAEAEALLTDWEGFLARPDQIEPEGDWYVWLALAGRGWGKTRAGSEWIRGRVKNGAKRIALIGETQKDLEEVMINGDSGILSVFPESERPQVRYKPVRLTFPNGAIALGYNATEPKQLRGPQFDTAWCDELAKWRHARETWDQLQFGMRLGDKPRVFVTTTPQPTEIIKSMAAGGEGPVHVTKGRTMDNRANLAPGFVTMLEKRYGGTRLGRQELDAEILGDLPGALWTMGILDTYRVSEQPELGRVLVGIDPAVTSGEESDEHGLIVVGQSSQEAYVLEDGSMRGTPMEWANAAVSLAARYGADGVVVEVNQGGDMVAHTLRTVAPNLNVIEVLATRGKHVRAEPVSALYQQGKVHHVGAFRELETQMTQMTTDGYKGNGSPDRVDALVWVMTELFPDMVDVVPDASRYEVGGSNNGWLGA